MTPTVVILAAALVGPVSEDGFQTAATEPVASSATADRFETVREAREGVTRALRESNRANRRDPLESTRAVVDVYRRLSASESVSAAERRRLQTQLSMRLMELHDVLRRRV